MNVLKNIILGTLVHFIVFSCSPRINIHKLVADVEYQTSVMLEEIPKAKAAKATISSGGTPGATGELISPRTLENGELKLVSSRDWTSGFFPGQLWLLYEFTQNESWKKQAQVFTSNMEKEKTNGTTHDMGFKMYCSFGEGYRLTDNSEYRDILIQSAKTLITRFNNKTGTIRSWDHNRNKWAYPVIIDNMMNLELLFKATQFTGDSSYYKIAISHANKTMENHFRPDHSSFHVVDYDTANGQVIQRQTHQGYSHASAWSRGQAWALYGFTMCFRFSKDKKYLEKAENIAQFILSHPRLPKDKIPFWDFDAPLIPNEPRDASAGSIIASALFELSLYSQNGHHYRSTATTIIKNLSDHYRSALNENRGFLLLHSTGSAPAKSEVDVPITYADYYYLEALNRYRKLSGGKLLW